MTAERLQILPSTVPIDDARVQSELTRYLSDNWAPIIEKDVTMCLVTASDSSSALPWIFSSRSISMWS